MTTIGMTLRPRRKRTRSDCVERNGNVAEQHEQDADRTGNDVVMDDDDAAAGLVALRGEPEEEDEREAAHGLVALRKRVNIVFEKVEDDDVVNAVFDGYVDKTQGKVIVVAEEKKRLAFFTKKPEIGASGTLKKQLPSREERFKAYVESITIEPEDYFNHDNDNIRTKKTILNSDKACLRRCEDLL